MLTSVPSSPARDVRCAGEGGLSSEAMEKCQILMRASRVIRVPSLAGGKCIHFPSAPFRGTLDPGTRSCIDTHAAMSDEASRLLPGSGAALAAEGPEAPDISPACEIDRAEVPGRGVRAGQAPRALTPWEEHLAGLARRRLARRGGQITLCSWNVQMLSVSVGTPAELVQRARRVVDVLLAAGPYDVICLQASARAWHRDMHLGRAHLGAAVTSARACTRLGLRRAFIQAFY